MGQTCPAVYIKIDSVALNGWEGLRLKLYQDLIETMLRKLEEHDLRGTAILITELSDPWWEQTRIKATALVKETK